jgi:hypothetical protein
MRSLIGGHRFPYKWNPKHRARVGLLPRGGEESAVIWCDVDPAYVFHVANAFDAPDGAVVVDVVAYATMFNKNLRGPDAKGALERWTIDPVAKSVERQVIDAEPQEFRVPTGDALASLSLHLCQRVAECGRRVPARQQASEARHGRVELGRCTTLVRAHPGEFVFIAGVGGFGRGRRLADRLRGRRVKTKRQT